MIRKALIPIAGLGTRLAPLSRVVPKAMLPLVDAAGRVRSVLHVICAEARAGGIEQVGLVVSPGQEETCRAYFDAARAGGAHDLPERVEYICQDQPAGFGDAVALGADFVGADERFLVMLGDHVQLCDPGAAPCTAQVPAAFERMGGAAMIGVKTICRDELQHVGVVRGQPLDDRIYRCTRLIEKPTAGQAADELVTPGLPEGHYLAHSGLYAFGTEIFDCLAEVARRRTSPADEVELSDAQSLLLERFPDAYHLLHVRGQAHDTGTPAAYARTFQAFAKND